MALVNYSDSEGSDDEKPQLVQDPTTRKAPGSKFSIDRAAPQKIRVNLSQPVSENGTHEDEPAAKRPRIGAGGFSGFNAMLPPPKREAEKTQAAAKVPARKVFSLKTGAEPGFSRESDAEMRQFFAEQETSGDIDEDGEDTTIPDVPKKQTPALPNPVFDEPLQGNAFRFKPLSVSRGAKTKKKATNGSTKAPVPPVVEHNPAADPPAATERPIPAPKKVSLFSSGETADLPDPMPEDPIPTDEQEDSLEGYSYPEETSMPSASDPNTLNDIALDLNLSAADRRQLFGRSGKSTSSATAINVMNFNIDQEYAANQEAIANGEQVQHNPVRAIAPGKHSLRQLIGAAQGQKDALEESFVAGKRNKKEAGSKYGW